MAIEVGQEAPDFTLRDPDGESVTLSSFRGVRNVVLVFYPAAFSEVCTRQLTDIGAHGDRYADVGAQVIGISVDSRYSQGRFARDLGLTDAILLSDFLPRGEVARRYGCFAESYGTSGRATFVIDRDGVVRSAHVTETPLDVPDEEQFFRALAACPV